MALHKRPNSNAAPAFEDENVAVQDTPETKADQAKAKAAAQAAVTVAKASAGAVSTNVRKFGAAYQDYLNRIDPSDVEGMAGAFPKITADLGGLIYDGEKETYDEVEVELVSYNSRYLISTNTQGEEAKKLLRTSYDNVYIAGTQDRVDDYVADLKEQGYEKAGIREYFDLWVTVLAHDGRPVAEEEQGLTHFQLSPQSVKAFKAFQVSLGYIASRGRIELTGRVKVGFERKEFGGNKFAHMTFRN